MEILKKILFFLLITWISLNAEDSVLIDTHIRMIPKIMALDSKNQSKTSKATLAIVYEGNRKSIARSIADAINQNYKGKVANLPFNAIVLSVDELFLRHDVSFVYITKMSERSVKKIAQWGVDNTVPTFSYERSDLEYGILGSIAIERSTIIYVNKPVFKEGNFRFNETLFQVARLIE